MSKKTCFAFEATNHRYLPLDGFMGTDGIAFVSRLYCPSCGRVIPATMSEFTLARTEVPSDSWTTDPNIVRKADA